MRRKRDANGWTNFVISSSVIFLISCVGLCSGAIRCAATRNMYSSPSRLDDSGKSYLHYPSRSPQQSYRDGDRPDFPPYETSRQNQDFDPLAYTDNQALRVPERYNHSFSNQGPFRNSTFGNDPYLNDRPGYSLPNTYDGLPDRNNYDRGDPGYADRNKQGPYNNSRPYNDRDRYPDARGPRKPGLYNDSNPYGDHDRYQNGGPYNDSRRYDDRDRYPERSGRYVKGPYNDSRRGDDRYPDYDSRDQYSGGAYNGNGNGRNDDRYNSSYRIPERVREQDYDPDRFSNRTNRSRDPDYGYDDYPNGRSSRYGDPDRNYGFDYPLGRSSSLKDPDYNTGRPEGRYDNPPWSPDRNNRDGPYGNSSGTGRDRDFGRPDRYPGGNYSANGRDRYDGRPGGGPGGPDGPGDRRDYGRDYGDRDRPDRSSCPIQTKETKSSHADVPTTSASAILSTPVGDFILYCSPHPAKTIISYPLHCNGDEGMGKDAVHTIIEESCYDIRVVDDLNGDLLKPQHLVITLAKGADSAAYQVDYESGSIRLLPCLHVFEYKYLSDVETILMGDDGTLIAFANNNVDPSAEQYERYAPIYLTKNGEIALCGFAELTETTDVTSWKKIGDSVLLIYSQRRGNSRRYLLHLMEVRLRNGYCDVRRYKNQKTIGGAPYRGHRNTLCASQPFTIDQCLCGVEDLQVVRGSQKDNVAHLAVALSNNVKDENMVGCADEEVLSPVNSHDLGFCCCPWANQRSFLVAFSPITNSFDHLDRSPVAFQQLYGGPASVTGISQLQTEQCCPVFQTVSPVGTTELYTLEYNGQGQLQVYIFIDHGLPAFVERSSYGYCEDNDIIVSYTLHSFQAENTIYHIRCNRDGKYTFDSYKLHKDRYAKGQSPASSNPRLTYTSGNSTYNRTSPGYPQQTSYAPFESPVPPVGRSSSLQPLQRTQRDEVVIYDGLAASPQLTPRNPASLYDNKSPSVPYQLTSLAKPVQVAQYQEVVTSAIAQPVYPQPYPAPYPPPQPAPLPAVSPYYPAPEVNYQPQAPYYPTQHAPGIRYADGYNRTHGPYREPGRGNRTSLYQSKSSSYVPPVQYGPPTYSSSPLNGRYQNLYR